MLEKAEIEAKIPVRDVEAARRFYEQTLGFPVVHETPSGISYSSGRGKFATYPTESAGKAEHTLLAFLVDDIEATVDELTTKGVAFEQYDMEGLKTDARGIADFGTEKGAWFKDLDGNILTVWQTVE